MPFRSLCFVAKRRDMTCRGTVRRPPAPEYSLVGIHERDCFRTTKKHKHVWQPAVYISIIWPSFSELIVPLVDTLDVCLPRHSRPSPNKNHIQRAGVNHTLSWVRHWDCPTNSIPVLTPRPKSSAPPGACNPLADPTDAINVNCPDVRFPALMIIFRDWPRTCSCIRIIGKAALRFLSIIKRTFLSLPFPPPSPAGMGWKNKNPCLMKLKSRRSSCFVSCLTLERGRRPHAL